jgi:hypothetical protein
MAEPESKIALAADLARARAQLGRNLDALRHDLDVPTHLKRSFEHHKAAYVGGATFLGLVLSKLPARRKKIYVERKTEKRVKEAEKAGVWLLVLQFLFKTLRPMLSSLVANQLTAYVKSRGATEKH